MMVLKIGGSILKKGLNPTLIIDIKKTLETRGLIIVHGGGDEVTKIAENLGKQQKFIFSPGGIRSRYTDEETVKIYTMVMAGKINKEIVALLLSKGIPAIGLSGIDATLLRAKRKKRLVILDERGRRRIIEGGFTGKIDQVNVDIIKLLINNGYLLVVSSVAIGEEYEFLNVDSDRTAAQIAGALNAEKIIFLTDVQGVFIDGKLVRRFSLLDAKRLLPKMGPGMDKKVMASIEAIKMGVNEAIITLGSMENPITKATSHQISTVISRE
ncbi:[LysW]-aminoadipate/[LysW]-glutamate kinase [Candidatus Bathyarchaeota archaeon]|nr:[LysW]-aminoadipate/[LysW]-glutamate kinase [Candidatus Bathyarchaeota archaeon]